ncbi:hypothetical protein D3C72_2588680 [compost metagenome]
MQRDREFGCDLLEVGAMFRRQRAVAEMEDELVPMMGKQADRAHGGIGRRPEIVIEGQCDMHGHG